MDITTKENSMRQQRKTNQNIQVYVRVRPLNARERGIRSAEVIDVMPPREIVTRHTFDSKLTKKFTFDRTFGADSRQVEVYSTVVAPLIEEVLAGYNCTVFAYGQTGTGKTHTMVGNESAELKSSWEDDSDIGIIPRALSHLFDELRMMEVEYTMRISYLELYNEELCDLLSTDDTIKIRIFDDTTKKGSVIIQGLEEIPVHSKDDVYRLLEKGKERRKTATTLMNAQSSRSHTVFSILVHIRENGIEGEDMLKIGKLNLVDLAGSENVSKAGNEKGIRVRETVNINQSLLTLGRVITALVERTPHIPYRESKLTRLLQESLGGRTKTSIIATISPGHKDIEETLSTLEYAHRAKNIQNKPEVNQKLTKKTVLKEYTEEIDKLKRDLMAARDKNGIYLAEETYNEMTLKMDSQNRELNEKMLLLKALKDELQNKEKIFNEVSLNLVEKTAELKRTSQDLTQTKGNLVLTKKVLHNTKRRYKEKKVLVESHVKTEKELLTQANKILEVADVATNDTHELHSTIERRKDVDQKILTACESFVERMHGNFELLDGSLDQYQEKQNSSTQLLNEELSNCTDVHNRLLSCSIQNIDNIKRICLDSLTMKMELHTELTKAIDNVSEEQRATLTQLFEKLQEREIEAVAQINANIIKLEADNEQQKSNTNALHHSIKSIINNNTDALNDQTLNVRKQLEHISRETANNFKLLADMQTKFDNEQALIMQEQKAIDDFVRSMTQLKDLRIQNNNEIFDIYRSVEKTQQSVAKQTQQSSECIESFEKQYHVDNMAAMQTIEENVDRTVLCYDESSAKYTTLQMQLDELCKDNNAQLDTCKTTENSLCTKLKKACTDSEAAVTAAQEQSSNELIEASTMTQTAINEETQRVRGHVAIVDGYVKDMKTHLDEYNALHRANLQNCYRDIAQFQGIELKTYTPTGATPSKRNFSYPRSLTVTSPHNEIIKRFRQEQDWSDLDTTATIDECSEDEEPVFVEEFSATETMLNSTPFDTDNGSSKRNSTVSVCSNLSANVLKVSQQTYRNVSLPQIKMSNDIKSPNFEPSKNMDDDKENFA